MNQKRGSHGDSCSVVGCTNYRGRTLLQGISYFRFPSDPTIRKQWEVRCGKVKFPKKSVICSEHFAPDDFERDLVAELLPSSKKRTTLKSGAVPTLNLPRGTDPSTPKTCSGVMRQLRYKLRMKKEMHDELISELLAGSASDLNENHLDCEHNATEPVVFIEEVDEEKLALRKEIEELKKVISDKDGIITSLANRVKELEEMINFAAEEKLKGIFSKNELELLLKKKMKVRWGYQEISKAFTLRYLSKRAYTFVKDKMNYPLPGISSLQRWARNLSIDRGVLHHVIDVMNIYGEELSIFKKLTILSFDEMKVQEKIEYNQATDEYIGPHSQALVIMARGLCSSWKQPVYVDFDVKLNKKLIVEVINHLFKIGFIVVGCVSDCAAGNRGLWNELGVDLEKTFFEIDGRKIFIFPDAPHLLKLIRNWMLDHGFVLEDGNQVAGEPLEMLVKLTSTELNVCHKLSREHLEVVGSQRQKVRLATELLSHTTARALEYYAPSLNCDTSLIKTTATFIKNVNDWFDIMNSRFTGQADKDKLAYGLDKERQDEKLKEVYNLILNMRCRNKGYSLQVFQKAVCISIKSLQQLFNYVNEKFNVSYILTNKLNQDVLENLFSQIRTRGGLDDHPTPMNFMSRIRMIILGRNPGVVAQTSTTVEKMEEYIMAFAIKQSDIKIAEDDPEESGSESDTGSESSVTSRDCFNVEIPQNSHQPEPETTKDALEYLAGYIAKKFKSKYPDLGQFSYQNNKEHGYCLPSWTEFLSKGGLTVPSPEFLRVVCMLEDFFIKIVGSHVPRGVNITKKVALKMKIKMRDYDVPYEVIKFFTRTRLMIRMRFINSSNMEGKKSRQVFYKEKNKQRKSIL